MVDLNYFDEVCERDNLGSRFDPGILGHGMAVQLGERKKRVKDILAVAAKYYHGLPPIHLEFTLNPRLASWVFGDRSQYYMGYSMGAEYILILLFHRLLADQSVLPKIGDPSGERPSLMKLSKLIGDHPSMDSLVGKVTELPEPKHPHRIAMAFYSRRAVGDFIILHELAHLVSGHIEYRDEHFGFPLLADPGHPSTSEEQRLVNQALERQADEWATFQALLFLKTEFGTSDKHLPPFDQLHKIPKEILYYWSFAICCFCRLFGDRTLAGSNMDARSHPPWRFRQLMIIENAYNLSKIQFFEGVFGTTDDVQESLERGLSDAETAMCQMTDEPRSHAGLVEDIDAYKSLLKRVFVEDLLPELRPYGPKAQASN